MKKGFYSVVAFCLIFLFATKIAEACIHCGYYDGSCGIAKALTLDRFQAVKGIRTSELVTTETEVKAGIGKKTGVGTVSVFCRGNQANIATCVAKDAKGNTIGTPARFKLTASGKLVVQE
ncbi:MAG: hypothetical protein ND895_13400 [Pyrinomonadaceae bacterium]|nr:hypothetical protein [Pyrinomonadaceae bacterium]